MSAAAPTLDKRTLILFPLMFVFYEMATFLSNDMYLPALPSMVEELGLHFSAVQFTLTSWFLGASLWQLLLGPLSDRFGRRPLMFTGGAIFVVSSLLCALTSNLSLFFLGRFLQGSTVSAMLIAGYSSINELCDDQQAIKTLAWMSSITILAPAFGPLIGAALLPFGSWRTIFAGLAIMALLPLCVMWKVMPESLTTPHPLALRTQFTVYKGILTNGLFWRYTSASCLLFSAIILWLAAGPFLIVEAFHEPVMYFGLYQIPVFGSFILGTRLLGKYLERYDALFFINMGLGACLIGALLQLCCALLLPSEPLFMAGLMLFLFGSGLSFSPLQRLAVDACTEPMGARIALFTNIRSVFGLVASALIASLGQCSLGQVAALFTGVITITLLSYAIPVSATRATRLATGSSPEL